MADREVSEVELGFDAEELDWLTDELKVLVAEAKFAVVLLLLIVRVAELLDSLSEDVSWDRLELDPVQLVLLKLSVIERLFVSVVAL